MKKIFHLIQPQSLLILFILFTLTYTQQQQFVDPIPVSNIQKPTIVQANHYFSSKEKSVNYNVVKLNKSRPVLVIPKNLNKQRQQFSNKINITLNDNQGNYISCVFQDNHELCVLQKFNTQTLSMIIQCESLPCQFSWEMIQTPIQKIDTSATDKSSQKQLYQIQQSKLNRHLTLKATCDSPQFEKDFHHQLQFYANKENYHRLKTQGITYYLFNNPPTSFKQYFYIKINQKYRSCAKLQIYNQQTNVSLNTIINDFVLAGKNVVYDLPSSSKDLQVDANFHLFSKDEDFTGNISVKLMGTIGRNQQTIRKMSLPTKTKKKIQFSFVLNSISSSYSNLQLMIDSTNLDCIIKFQLISGELQKVQKGQYSFFSLKKGQKIKYQIVQNPAAQSSDKTFIFPSDEHKVKLSRSDCESKKGCEFQLQVQEDFDGSIYIGQSRTENTQQFVKQAIDKTFTKRVKQDTTIYLRKTVQQNKNYQVVVNTHNVLLYAANEQKCPQPHEKCHQKVGNSHNPFIYQSEKKGNLIIAVHALDSTQFTVTIIEGEGQFPQLKDGVPFMYLMDDGQEQVGFKFNLDQKQDVTFSLISPLNQLALLLYQSNKLPKNYLQKTDTYTAQGFINLKKSQIKSKQFILIVRKIDPQKTLFVHFTLIASTKNANIKLESGVTHHQKLSPNQHQDFVLQFDPSKSYVVSFYVHNAIGQKINISLELSKDDTYTQKNKQTMFYIDHAVDQIDISSEGIKVCQSQQTSSCQVFLRLKNKMDKNVNLQLTLLSTNSIVELHDGLWQYFPQQLTSTTTHFYFFPKHINNPVTILYQSNNPDLRLFYSLTKMDIETINPELWNFPSLNYNPENHQFLNLNHKQVKHISISKQALATCSPDCLILMTLAKSDKVKGQFKQVDRDKQFGIMIQNNIVQIPQKTRIDITIQKQETKYLKMNLKNLFQKHTLTSYIHTSLGSVSIYANACNQKMIRMPSNQEYDFSFGILQTQLRTQTIKNKFEANGIDYKQNPSLCLAAVANEHTKFSIEYTSEEEIISLLRLDQTRTVSIQKDESKYLQIQASVQNTVKIVRNKGFPFIEQKKCTGVDMSYQQCFEEFQEDQDKDPKSQMAQKVKRYVYEPCQKCIVYLKIHSLQSAQVDIHLESKYTEITLQQKKIVTDYLQKNEQNRYQITTLSMEPTFITLNAINGDIKCKVTDLNSINIQKQTNKNQRVLHFSITPNQLTQAKNKLGQSKDPFSSLFSGFGLQMIFSTLHISVSSIDTDKGASYTIQYSSGARQSFLQDGLVSHYKLEGNDPRNVAKFYYQNLDQNSNVYIFLGSKSSTELSKLNINIYQMQNDSDQENKKQINSKIPQIRKKTVRPTVLYPLPTAKFYSIEVSNPTGAEVDFSIGVNHQQVILMPYDIDYPFPLKNLQDINFILDVQNKGYVLLTFKKCDQSSIQISYTNDYQSFQKGDFQYTTTLTSEPKLEELVKIKQPGLLYINIKRNQQEGISTDAEYQNSVFSLNAKFSSQKMRTTDFLKPGNKGLISYSFIENNKIQIQFNEVTCDTKDKFCGENFEYYLVASDKMVDVYSQSVCPSTYFAEDIQSKQKHTVLPLRKILQKPDSNHKITTTYQYDKINAIYYVAVKAVFKNKENESIQIYYQPIQVVTIWGQFQKASNKFGMKFLIGFVVIFGFCAFLVCLRRKKRKGYASIQQNN